MVEPIHLSKAAAIVIIGWVAVLFCWEELVVWWNKKDDDK